MTYPDFVLSLSCPDRRGIVAEVSRFLFERNCNILDSQQFGDRANGRFFMRVHGQSEGGMEISQLEGDFTAIGRKFAMDAQFFDSARKTRAVIMVSKFGHALVDLLYRVRIGAIRMDVPLIVSNSNLLPSLVRAPVFTTQIAPKILKMPRYDPNRLDAVRLEGTKILPNMIMPSAYN